MATCDNSLWRGIAVVHLLNSYLSVILNTFVPVYVAFFKSGFVLRCLAAAKGLIILVFCLYSSIVYCLIGTSVLRQAVFCTSLVFLCAMLSVVLHSVILTNRQRSGAFAFYNIAILWDMSCNVNKIISDTAKYKFWMIFSPTPSLLQSVRKDYFKTGRIGTKLGLVNMTFHVYQRLEHRSKFCVP